MNSFSTPARCKEQNAFFSFSFFSNFYFYFILLYNTVLVLLYIDMNQPQVYMSSQSWIPLPPPTPYHLSGSSPCTSPKHPVSCIKHRLAIDFLNDSIHVSMPFSKIIPPSPSPTEWGFMWAFFLKCWTWGINPCKCQNGRDFLFLLLKYSWLTGGDF